MTIQSPTLSDEIHDFAAGVTREHRIEPATRRNETGLLSEELDNQRLVQVEYLNHRLWVPLACFQSPWFQSAIRELTELSSLPHNWDSYGASSISNRSLVETFLFLCYVMNPESPLPHFTPVSNGSVQLEWHQGGVDLEAMLFSPGTWEITFEDHNTNEEVEYVIDLVLAHDKVRKHVARIA